MRHGLDRGIVCSLIVGTGRIKRGNFEAFFGIFRANDFCLEQIGFAVMIRIEIGFDVDDFENQFGRVKDGLGLTVEEDRLFGNGQVIEINEEAKISEMIEQRLAVFAVSCQKVVEGTDQVG